MTAIKNVGPASSEWLAGVGVESLEDLERVGAVEAYRRVKERHPDKASVNLLWALQGALMDMHWTAVPDAVKEQLLDELGEG